MERSMASGGGDIDWAARWRDLVETRRRRIEALPTEQAAGAGAAGGGYWDRRADQFRRLSEQHDPAADPLVALLAEALAGGTLLDVGAGAGRYALPLAAQASLVTAVEPSAGMRSHLEERARAAGLANLRVVPATWEEAEVDPHDVVLASHILYPIADVVPFVQKLVAHARRAWFLTIRVDPLGAELAPLWREVWGTPYPEEPTFLDLYHLLFALGLRPNARLKPFAGPPAAASLDEALALARSRLFLPEGRREHDARIRAFLAEHMREQGGRWQWPGRRQEAVIYATV